MNEKTTITSILLILGSWLLTDQILLLFKEAYIKFYTQLEQFDFIRDHLLTETNIFYIFHIIVTYFLVIKLYLRIVSEKCQYQWSKKYIWILLVSCIVLIISIYFTNKVYALYLDEIIGTIISQMLFVAIVEELIYRVTISTILEKSGFNFKERIILSVFIFEIMHLISFREILLQLDFVEGIQMLFAPLIFGMILAILYEKEHQLIPLIVIHGTYNSMSLLTIGTTKNIACGIYLSVVLCATLFHKNERRESNEEVYDRIDFNTDGDADI
ncbi:CPBP family intramembrane glutamic endopeptidase [Emergencia sp. 1XD21-10]|uniref:CPBP family intramembrane glutamic endopeptidase n=1 Tax=Emergencia sp. 1XD21-10 TaxID=2304569 RepID=UPI00137B69FC|nr:CPBP family intramembrane glutamic endopeptidase [Emergencia sp. 1XD21-10]NCF00622.1 CPBP family intramembrane metalloprotease [Emergencia sp. 1XD21-10]